MPDARTSDNRGKFNYSSVFERGLAIDSLNINSLLSHIDELRVFISCSKVDILIINESKLDSTIHDNELYLAGFEIVRRDRRVNGRKGGGFRSLHSTLTPLLEATNSWSVDMDNVFLNGVVFIDLKKAFDTIDHEIILRKMPYFGADQATITSFQSYLSNWTHRCNVNGRLSTPRTITCGVLQGSILGPLLFLMYINDLPNCLREASPRMFADDTNLTLTAKTLKDL